MSEQEYGQEQQQTPGLEQQQEQQQQEEKSFTQADVDRIVGERLARERRGYADYGDLKEIEALLTEYGYQGTAAEKKALLKQMTAAQKQAQDQAYIQQRAFETGLPPEVLTELNQLRGELNTLKQEKAYEKQTVEQKKQADAAFAENVADFNEKHPDIDLQKLVSNPEFVEFVQDANPRLTLAQIYDKYVKLAGKGDAAALAKMQANAARATSSGKGAGAATGGTFGLTPQQQRLAKENKMSNKEYAEILAHIKR